MKLSLETKDQNLSNRLILKSIFFYPVYKAILHFHCNFFAFTPPNLNSPLAAAFHRQKSPQCRTVCYPPDLHKSHHPLCARVKRALQALNRQLSNRVRNERYLFARKAVFAPIASGSSHKNKERLLRVRRYLKRYFTLR